MECHGSIESVRIKFNAYHEEQVDVHLKTSLTSASDVEPEFQNCSQAADYATLIDENLDHKWKGSGKHRFHLTRF